MCVCVSVCVCVVVVVVVVVRPSTFLQQISIGSPSTTKIDLPEINEKHYSICNQITT